MPPAASVRVIGSGRQVECSEPEIAAPVLRGATLGAVHYWTPDSGILFPGWPIFFGGAFLGAGTLGACWQASWFRSARAGRSARVASRDSRCVPVAGRFDAACPAGFRGRYARCVPLRGSSRCVPGAVGVASPCSVWTRSLIGVLLGAVARVAHCLVARGCCSRCVRTGRRPGFRWMRAAVCALAGVDGRPPGAPLEAVSGCVPPRSREAFSSVRATSGGCVRRRSCCSVRPPR